MAHRNAAIVTELMLATRIAQTARIANAQMTVVKPEEALETLRREPPDRVFVDLEAGPEMASLIAALKREPALEKVPVIGFYPHVRTELRDAGLQAGLDRALPRSAFLSRLARLVTGLVDSTDSTNTPTDTEVDATMPEAEARPTTATPIRRVHISCPGCGRHDHVSWPEGWAVYHWKCFNCGKEFDLARDGAH